MNCKPGELAVCIRHSAGVPVSPLGRLCTVLYAAPLDDFRLPDGQRQIGRRERGRTDIVEWVVEWQSLMAYPMELKGAVTMRWTRFGVCPDFALRPIRDPGDDARDETLEWLPAPRETAEVQ